MVRRAWAATGVWIVLCCAAAAREPGYAIGRGGWDMERFGSEATILRSRPSGSGQAALFLSCAGPDRRLRLVLPDAVVGQAGAAEGGLALMRTREAAIVGRFTQRSGALGFTDRAVVLFVLAALRASASDPSGVDVVLRFGNGERTLGRLTPLHLFLTSAPADAIAFGTVSDACGTVVRTTGGSAPQR